MVRKLPRVEWPDDTFIETVKIWQKEWFYITEPRGAAWAEIPAFRSGPPPPHQAGLVDQERPRLGVNHRGGAASEPDIQDDEEEG